MATNAISPWEGTLEWVGEVKSGQGQKGTWKSVDFCLKYTDHQMNEKFIVFSAFGEDKVDKILSFEHGTALKVVWWPDANQARNGVYYAKNSVISIGLAQTEAKSADTKIKVPDFPQQPANGYAPMPQARSYPQPHPPLPESDTNYQADENDLPFD